VFACAALLIVACVAVEMRAAEPVLPIWVFGYRTLNGGNVSALMVGVVLIGLSSYVPTFAQGVLHTGPLIAGFVLAAMSVGWPIASALSGRAYMRIGFRDTAAIGAVVLVAGAIACLLLPQHTHLIVLAGACFLVGAGLGLNSTPVLVALQSVVGWDRRGVVTGTNMFFRSMGSAVGAAVFGAIANTTLTDRFAHPPAGLSGHLPRSADATALVLNHRGSETAAVGQYVRASLYQATHYVFAALLVASALCLLAVLAMPRKTVALDPTGTAAPPTP